MSNPLHPDDPASVARFKLFYRWLHNSESLQQIASEPGPLNNLQTILEDALWSAYQAGYSQAANDSEAAQRLVALLNGTKSDQ